MKQKIIKLVMLFHTLFFNILGIFSLGEKVTSFLDCLTQEEPDSVSSPQDASVLLNLLVEQVDFLSHCHCFLELIHVLLFFQLG